jgi:hypothetical protein
MKLKQSKDTVWYMEEALMWVALYGIAVHHRIWNDTERKVIQEVRALTWKPVAEHIRRNLTNETHS